MVAVIRSRTVVIAVLLACLSVLVVPAQPALAASGTPLRGAPILTQQELLSWFQATTTVPFRAGNGSVTPQQLIAIYYEEGAREGIAADRAFIQAVLETGYFEFPDGKCVHPTDNNFAGMGAYDCHVLNDDGRPKNVWRFSSVRDGVRAQMQYLRAYGDPSVSKPSDLGAPIPTAREGRNFTAQWQWIVDSYRVVNGGPWTVYEQYGSGIWAADPLYWPKLRSRYNSALTFNGYPADAGSQSRWLLRNSNSGGAHNVTAYFGSKAVGDVFLSCDWDGNGRSTPGVFRDGTWMYSNQANGGGTITTFSYGRAGDVPLCGDWNGNGQYGIGIVRNGRWHLRQTPSSGASQIQFTYGRVTQGDIPLVGDWNGNGRFGVGIVRDGRWHLRQTPSGGTGQIQFTYGRVTRGDIPVVGDWNRNGIHTPGIIR